MKIPIAFINRETVEIYLEFCNAFRHLSIGFKKLFICTVFVIPCIILTVEDLVFRKLKKVKEI